jgi:hypothetical protein
MRDEMKNEEATLYQTVDPRDGEYIATLPDAAQREAAMCTVTTYRQPEKWRVGDPAPNVTLTEMVTGRQVALKEFQGKPLFLIFGSYT